MKLLQALIARLFHHTVDDVLSGMSTQINRLDQIQAKKATEAADHLQTVQQAYADHATANAEAKRAGTVASRFRALIGMDDTPPPPPAVSAA